MEKNYSEEKDERRIEHEKTCKENRAIDRIREKITGIEKKTRNKVKEEEKVSGQSEDRNVNNRLEVKKREKRKKHPRARRTNADE